MPATAGLQPPLTPAEREIVKSGWGTWDDFLLSYGLKPYDLDDQEEGKAIVSAMAQQRGAK